MKYITLYKSYLWVRIWFRKASPTL